MFKLHVIQAQFGDSLLLQFGTPRKARYVLIDGGPPGNYAADLQAALAKIVGLPGKLDLVVLSHVDNDHIVGVLDLFADMEDDQVSERPLRVLVAQLWHNSFARTLDPTGEISQRLQSIMEMAGAANIAMPLATDAFYGVREGNRLRLMAQKLKIPTNRDFANDLILVETARQGIQLRTPRIQDRGPQQSQS